MADRPRPRPRPRPKQKVSSQQDAERSSTLGASSSTPLLPLPSSSACKQVQVQDSDEMFMRNRKRTSKTWEKLGKKDTKIMHVEGESDEGEVTSPRPRKQKRIDHRDRDMPRWQKDKNFVHRLLSVDLSENSDDGIEIIGTSTSKEKQTPKRSRSRSITPPPALPFHQLQNARNVVRQALDTAPPPASPTQFDADDSTDTIVLDPELARIAQAITSQTKSRANTYSMSSTDIADAVIVSVKWRPHPLNEAGKEDTLVFKMNRDDNFRDLFEATAEEAAVMTEDLIMSYNGKRLFSSATPNALKIWSEVEFVACDKVTYEYLHKDPFAVSQTFSTVNSTGPIEILSDDDVAPPPAATQESDVESESDGDKFKLILRSAITKDITLTVRSTTKCVAIVKAFLKKAGVADKYPRVFSAETGVKSAGGKKGKGTERGPRLCVDGDRMDNGAEIGDADLEDGDLVEVVGL